MTNPDLRLDEPGPALPTTEDLAKLAESREQLAALAPELVALIQVQTANGLKPVADATDRDLLELFAEGRKERARKERARKELLAEVDAEDAAGVRGECLGRDDSVPVLEYADWHPAL